MKLRCIPQLHPSYLMRCQEYIPCTISDIKKGLDVPPEYYNLQPTVDDVLGFCNAEVLCFDIETNRRTNQITMVGLATRPYYVTIVPWSGSYIGALKKVFASAKNLVGQNIVHFDIPFLGANDVKFLPNIQVWDTMLLQHLVQPDMPHDLEFISSIFTQKPAWKHLVHENEALYCFTPNHKLLGIDLRWNEASTYKIGDTVLGFDENGPNRKYRKATITNIEYANEPVFDVTLKSGKVFTVTGEHRWLVQNKSNGFSSVMHWSETNHLRPRNTYGEGQETKIPRLLVPWEQDFGRTAGWLAGMFDGEGTVKSTGRALQVAQNPGLLLNQLKAHLSEYVDFGESNAGRNYKTKYLRVRGTKADILKLLGTLRPERLIAKIDFNKLGRMENRNFTDSIISKEFKGIQRIIKITTDTSTLIVDGYPMHNCARDVDVTIQSYLQLRPLVKQLDMEDLYKYSQIPLAKICTEMHNVGVRTNPKKLKELAIDFRKDLEKLELQLPKELQSYDKSIRIRKPAPPGTFGKSGKPVKFIHEDATERIVPWNSPKIVGTYLYETLGLPEQFHPKTKKLTTDKDALERLFRKTKNPVLEILRQVQSLDTLINGFVSDDKENPHQAVQGEVHSNFLPHGTSTGRLSSSDPNMQNISPKAKFIYVPNHDDWCWIEADFSSLENTLAAYFANDEDRLRRMNEPGFNEHKWLANQIYGIPINEIDKSSWQYDRAKHTNHGADAGMGPRMMSMKYNVPEKDCRELLLMWKKLNWKSVQWQERCGNQGVRDGILRNPFGRKRWLWSQKAYTEGLRFMLQGSAADIVIRASIALLYERINWPAENVLKVSSILAPLPKPATLNVQIHDSLLVSSPSNLVEDCIKQMKKAMCQPWRELGGFQFKAAFKVGEKGQSWGELRERR